MRCRSVSRVPEEHTATANTLPTTPDSASQASDVFREVVIHQPGGGGVGCRGIGVGGLAFGQLILCLFSHLGGLMSVQ